MATATDRMNQFDRERTRRAAQRQRMREQQEMERQQVAQNANLERRGRAQEWKSYVAANPQANTLQNRQRYVVGGALPQGVEQQDRPSYISAGVRGQSLPEYEGVNQMRRMQQMQQETERQKAMVPLEKSRIEGVFDTIGTGIESLGRGVSTFLSERGKSNRLSQTQQFQGDQAALDRALKRDMASNEPITLAPNEQLTTRDGKVLATAPPAPESGGKPPEPVEILDDDGNPLGWWVPVMGEGGDWMWEAKTPDME